METERGNLARGAICDGRGTSFAVWSGAASAVELCLFDANGDESARLPLERKVDGTWRRYVPGALDGQRYGYRAHGLFQPERGLRFNAHKLLIDPYARALETAPRWHELHGGGDERLDARDSAAVVPRSLVVSSTFDWQGDTPPRTPLCDTLIYECHVKGLTALHPEIAPELRGTFLGLASEPVIEHLRALGVTAVELLPVHQAYSERFLVERGLSNYWGYNTVAFFAPDARFAAFGRGESVVGEFKTMVRALHRAGIEVILDVVYNHSGEADALGPTLCLRGLDNAAYYQLDPDDARRYADFTGCGNTVNLAHPQALRLCADSLRYWVQEMHVDGFRFDLATALARSARGAIELDRGLFAVIEQDPVLSRVKRIAEPWDAADGGMRLGGFMPGWAEWNGRYRDGVRRFFRGDGGQLGELATRLAGSSDLFGAQRGPHASVHYVTCHDGFTLRDLTSYEQKHNQANGWDNRDGENDNASRNYGVEGPTDRREVAALRERAARSLLATVALSLGVPMLSQGDEMGRTQHGNNNPYGHDSALSWVDWRLDAGGRALLAFVRRCLALRRQTGLFRRLEHLRGEPVAAGDGAPKDVAWLRPEGGELSDQDWRDPERRALGMLTCGHDQGGRPDAALPRALLLVNGGDEAVRFALPDCGAGRGFRVLVDSGDEAREGRLAEGALALEAHAVCWLQSAPARSAERA